MIFEGNFGYPGAKDRRAGTGTFLVRSEQLFLRRILLEGYW